MTGDQDRREDFAALYDEHVWAVFGFFGYRTASRELAEDLTQATFERALRAWDRFDPQRAGAGTWLLAIARNLLIDHYRREGVVHREPLAEGEAADAQVGPSPELESGLGLSPDLEAALSELGERERELIGLRFGGDLNGPEIAELTGLTLANVHQILSRALRKLRSRIEGEAARAL